MRHTRLALIAAIATIVPYACADECTDENAGCATWAKSGECDRNPGFMRSSCAKSCNACPAPIDPKLVELSVERVTLHILNFGDIELAFYPNAAPVTVAHITKLFRMGCYDTNHIFRVDKGFVAQIQSVHSGSVQKPLSEECKVEAEKTVPGEFTAVRHKRGILSMGRMTDPDSGGSSFSMLLGRAAHLDEQYTVFGEVVAGDEVLSKLEEVETTKQGIFVMPKNRITISHSTMSKDHYREL